MQKGLLLIRIILCIFTFTLHQIYKKKASTRNRCLSQSSLNYRLVELTNQIYKKTLTIAVVRVL